MEPKNKPLNIQIYTLDGEPILPMAVCENITWDDLKWSGDNLELPNYEPLCSNKEITIELDLKKVSPWLSGLLDELRYREIAGELFCTWILLEAIRLGHTQPLLP